MLLNVITLGLDNPVVLKFELRGEFKAKQLNGFDYLQMEIGGEEYSTAETPEQLFVPADQPDHLYLKIGATTALPPGKYRLTLRGYNARYPNGYELNGATRRLLQPVEVKRA